MKTSDKEIIEIIADQLLIEFPGTEEIKAFEKAARLYNIMRKIRWTKEEAQGAKKVLQQLIEDFD
jgi:hypothetical protein